MKKKTCPYTVNLLNYTKTKMMLKNQGLQYGIQITLQLLNPGGLVVWTSVISDPYLFGPKLE